MITRLSFLPRSFPFPFLSLSLSLQTEVQMSLIDNATAAVRAAAPKMSDAAMAAALSQLADPSARPVDPVQEAL